MADIKWYDKHDVNRYINYLAPFLELNIIDALRSKHTLEGFLFCKQLVDDMDKWDRLIGHDGRAESLRLQMIRNIERVYKIKVENRFFLFPSPV